MSYSSCIKCKTMVFAYEKYCADCVKTHGLKQDEDWHKGVYKTYDIDAELEKDKAALSQTNPSKEERYDCEDGTR